jgi:hypothetical protein
MLEHGLSLYGPSVRCFQGMECNVRTNCCTKKLHLLLVDIAWLSELHVCLSIHSLSDIHHAGGRAGCVRHAAKWTKAG